MTDKTYQQLRTELDEIAASLQAGELDVDDATRQYERGMQLIRELEQHLKTAEVNIEKVKAKFK